MRALDDQANKETSTSQFSGKSDDVELAVRMGVKLLNEANGIAVIRKALDQSKDPAQVIGQLLAQMMGTLAEELSAKADVDPRVFLAKGGFLDHILDYIEGKLGMPPEFSDQVYGQVLETVKAAAFGGQGGNTAPAQPSPQQAPQPNAGGM